MLFRKPDVELEMNVVQPPIPRTTVPTTSTSTTVRTKEELPAEKQKPPEESKCNIIFNARNKITELKRKKNIQADFSKYIELPL